MVEGSGRRRETSQAEALATADFCHELALRESQAVQTGQCKGAEQGDNEVFVDSWPNLDFGSEAVSSQYSH